MDSYKNANTENVNTILASTQAAKRNSIVFNFEKTFIHLKITTVKKR